MIETTVKWREITSNIVKKYTIKNVKPNSIAYEMHDGRSYLLKLFEDTKAVYDSKLYPEASFPDPFFLSYPLNEVFEERELIYKMRASELALLEELMNL